MKTDSVQITILLPIRQEAIFKRPQLIKALINRIDVSIKAKKLQVARGDKRRLRGGANMVIVGREWV